MRTEDNRSNYIGLTLEEAATLAKAESRPWRIAMKDGEAYFGTCDVVPHRLNFAVWENIVKSVSLG